MSAEVAVRASGLHKRFHDLQVLTGLDLAVEQSQTYGLVGPNGAGKTTLVRILCGLLRPSAGEAYVLGWRVPDFRIRSQIGYLPQDIALYPDLTVMENLRFFGALHGLSSKTLAERATELLSLVELSDRVRQRVGTLSGGMQRRTSLVVSLLHGPRLLFLDEPTVGVDPRLREILWGYFAELTQRGVTLILTTHLMEEAHRCHAIGFLNQGRLLASGSPQAILEGTGTTTLDEAFVKLETGERA